MDLFQYLRSNSNDNLFFFVNCAVSIDSKLSILGERINISNTFDWKIVHQMRNNLLALVVGARTIKVDDPSLLTKPEHIEDDTIHHPLRIILDPKNTINGSEKLFKFKESPILLVRSSILEGVDNTENLLIDIHSDYKNAVFYQLRDYFLKNELFGAIMIEGGGTVINSALQHPLVTRLRIFRSSHLIGSSGVSFYSDNPLKLELIESRQLGTGTEEIYNIDSSA